SAIEVMAAHCESCAASCSKTIRTARVRTSGENRLGLVMAPSSQDLEPPGKSGRFRLVLLPLGDRVAFPLSPGPAAAVRSCSRQGARLSANPLLTGFGRPQKDDGSRVSRLPGSDRRVITRRENDINTKPHEVSGQLGQTSVLLFCPSPLNLHCLAVNIA